MIITTTAFEHKASIPPFYTCDGQDTAPVLNISEVPKGAKSLALIMDDPDSPTGTWVHWTMWNILPDTAQIGGENLPQGAIEGPTSFDATGYGGPCPGSGEHRYFFKLYALDMMLDIPATSDKTALVSAMNGHILEQAELMGTYERV